MNALTVRFLSVRSIMLGAIILGSIILALLVVPASTAMAEYADVVLNKKSEKEGMRPVIYPHWFHRIRFRCKVCHGELGFEMRVGASDIDMSGLADGKLCGACHNGDIAWSLEYCDRCHSGLLGLKTKIHGGSSAGGPGYW